ncbi:uncharacterized protein DS421_19g665200 [Arachis hypogaea]|uniref:Uncharacterized protein n=1 Tax=Arachis hypogaea TaxID=3818 RepID=A0A6B9VCI8_ARAHY|nr:uncharacterized protein DS421_19g665200 [Arachis hypogaea]
MTTNPEPPTSLSRHYHLRSLCVLTLSSSVTALVVIFLLRSSSQLASSLHHHCLAPSRLFPIIVNAEAAGPGVALCLVILSYSEVRLPCARRCRQRR